MWARAQKMMSGGGKSQHDELSVMMGSTCGLRRGS